MEDDYLVPHHRILNYKLNIIIKYFEKPFAERLHCDFGEYLEEKFCRYEIPYLIHEFVTRNYLPFENCYMKEFAYIINLWLQTCSENIKKYYVYYLTRYLNSYQYQRKELTEILFLVDLGACINGTKTNPFFNRRWIFETINDISQTLSFDINFRNEKEQTALIKFCCIDYSTKFIRVLIQLGADINAVDIYKCSALNYAVKKHNINNATLLLESGANCNIIDEEGRNVLFYACTRDMKSLLIDYGAQKKLLDNYSQTVETYSRTVIFSMVDVDYIAKKCPDELLPALYSWESILPPEHYLIIKIKLKIAQLLISSRQEKKQILNKLWPAIRLYDDLFKVAILLWIELEELDILLKWCDGFITFRHYLPRFSYNLIVELINIDPEIKYPNIYKYFLETAEFPKTIDDKLLKMGIMSFDMYMCRNYKKTHVERLECLCIKILVKYNNIFQHVKLPKTIEEHKCKIEEHKCKHSIPKYI